MSLVKVSNMLVKHTSYSIKCTRNLIFVLSTPVRPQNLFDFFHSHNYFHFLASSNVPLHSGVLCRHLFDSFHWFHDLICREGLLHLPVLVHLVDALGDCNGHLLGRHPIVLPFCLLMENKWTIKNNKKHWNTDCGKYSSWGPTHSTQNQQHVSVKQANSAYTDSTEFCRT